MSLGRRRVPLTALFLRVVHPGRSLVNLRISLFRLLVAHLKEKFAKNALTTSITGYLQPGVSLAIADYSSAKVVLDSFVLMVWVTRPAAGIELLRHASSDLYAFGDGVLFSGDLLSSSICLIKLCLAPLSIFYECSGSIFFQS